MWLIILYAISISYVWVNILQMNIRFKVFNRKPFNCEVCMAGWIAGVLMVSNAAGYEAAYELICIMSLTMFLMSMLNRLIN